MLRTSKEEIIIDINLMKDHAMCQFKGISGYHAVPYSAIEWVSEDKKKVRTVIGSEYWLNKWYIWLPEGWGKNTIMMDNGWLYISDKDMSYRDPHF